MKRAAVQTDFDRWLEELSRDVRVGQLSELPVLRDVQVPVAEMRMPAGAYVLRVAPDWQKLIELYHDAGDPWPRYELIVSVGVGGVNESTQVITSSVETTRRLMLPAMGVAIPVRGSWVRASVIEQSAATKHVGVGVYSALAPGQIGESEVSFDDRMVAPLERDVDAVPAFASRLCVAGASAMVSAGFRRCGAVADELGVLVAPGESIRIPVPRDAVIGVVEGVDPVATSRHFSAWAVQS
jgi:hypothetical protein